MKTKINYIFAIIGAFITSAFMTVSAFATSITFTPNMTIAADAAPGSQLDPGALALGLAFWAARILGVVTIIWGIYTWTTAKKDGDPGELNTGIAKIIIGIFLLCLPTILKALKVVA